jgi:hypothetical protein
MTVLAKMNKMNKNWLLNKHKKIANYLVTLKYVLIPHNGRHEKEKSKIKTKQKIQKGGKRKIPKIFKYLTGSADALPPTNFHELKMTEKKSIMKTRAKYYAQMCSVTSSSEVNEPEVISIHSSMSEQPEVITINSTASESEIITVSSTDGNDIFDQETEEYEPEDDVFDPAAGTSNQADATLPTNKASKTGSGAGSYDNLLSKYTEKKTRSFRNKKSQCTGVVTPVPNNPVPNLVPKNLVPKNLVPKKSVRNCQEVIDISVSSNDDEISVRVLGASYKPTSAVKPVQRPDLNRPARSPETEAPNDNPDGPDNPDDPNANDSGDIAWGSWEGLEDPEQVAAIAGFRVPYIPNIDMGAFASSSTTTASANSSIGTVNMSDLD